MSVVFSHVSAHIHGNTKEGIAMNKLISDLKTAAHKRAVYRQTLRELRGLNIDTALDLDIYQADAHRIARQAVYGA